MHQYFESYEVQIERWARDRKIIPNSTALAQIDKAFEELAELRAALLADDREAIVDGFGDTEVCLINARALADVSMCASLDHAWQQIKDRTGRMDERGIFVKNGV